MNIITTHLDELYNEIMPKYDKLVSKEEEVSNKIKNLKKDLEKATVDYDLEAMEPLKRKITSAEAILQKIVSDLNEYKEYINKANNTKWERAFGVRTKITDALDADLKQLNEENKNDPRRKRMRELQKEIDKISDELFAKNQQKKAAYREYLKRFHPILTPDRKNQIDSLI